MGPSPPRTELRRWIGLAVVLSALLGGLWQLGLVARLEAMAYDWRLALQRSDAALPDEVAVVLIDDASLAAMEGVAGRWPWPRSVYADLLEFFAMAPPRAVIFDVMFSERQGAGGLGAPLDPHDQRLVEATAGAPFAVHAARLLRDTPDERNHHLLGRPLPAWVVDRFDPAHRYGDGEPAYYRALEIPSNNNFYLPFPELLEATGALGVVDVRPDADGVYRRVRLLHRYGDALLPALGAVAWLDRERPAWMAVRSDRLELPGARVPQDGEGHYLVNYYGRVQGYSFAGIMAALQRIRAGELEDLPVSPFEFEDRIVFVGASAAGLEDLKRTPVDARLPGVAIHAAVAANLLHGDFLRPLPPWSGPVGAFATLILVLALMATARRPSLRIAVPLLAAGAWLAIDLALFRARLVLPLAPPLLAVGLAALGAYALLLLTEGREKARFKRMMSQYLSPAVLETVVARHSDFAQAEVGRREHLTILFSDIRGFTSLSENLPPERVVELLNHYFSAMTEVIFRHQGTIDKFIGDAIMAFWGAPLRIDDHADQALLAALEMIERLEGVNAWLRERDYPPIAIGIGLHTGDVVLGNIGSQQKLDYTVIGDGVNLASRMEGLTKHYGVPVLLSEATLAELTLPVPCRVVDLVRVKGKRRPIRIYQPLGHPQRLDDATLGRLDALAHEWEAVMGAYLERRWDEAERRLAALPDDPLKALYLERLAHYRRQAPGPEWDGVATMTSK